MQKSDRLEKLRQMLEKDPNDAFCLYALGMELKSTDAAQAIVTFQKVIQLEPDHGYAYFQLGQTHELTGDTASAASAYRDGIAAARRRGDSHAEQEISAALDMIQ